MKEEVEMIMMTAEEKMSNSVNHLEVALTQIRAGKANTHILDGVFVDYYGSQTPLSQVSNISTPDAKTIAIQPWEKAMIPVIEKAIIDSNLGLNPDNNGETVRLFIPPVTEERRKELVKQVKGEGEDAKISIRNSRRDANDALKKLVKDGLSEDLEKDAEADVQKMTDTYGKKVDELVSAKEKEVLTV